MLNSLRATGTFDVNLVPQTADGSAGGPFGRYLIDKRYHGEIDGTSRGQMIGAATAVEGSAAYVALEQITGTLGGRRGSFILVHRGTMQGTSSTMTVTVVPDSGTDELTGLAGTMTIRIEGRQHFYDFDGTMPAA